jgi:hypothetical protein
MNRELRKAIYNKQMLRNKFEKYHTDKTWEEYRKQRNLVTKLKKRSVRTSSKIIPLLISFATFIKKRIKSITYIFFII